MYRNLPGLAIIANFGRFFWLFFTKVSALESKTLEYDLFLNKTAVYNVHCREKAGAPVSEKTEIRADDHSPRSYERWEKIMRLKSMLKKSTALLSAVIMAAGVLTGCGGSTETSGDVAAAPETSAAQEEGSAGADAPEADESRKSTANSDELYEKVTIGISEDPNDLSPTGYGAYSYMGMAPIFYESLFDLRDNDYVPILAKDYEEIDDLHWDVHLYDYIQDSAGNAITADDVVFSYQVLIDSGQAMRYDYFENVEAVDDYTVRFTWAKPVDAVAALEWPWCRTWIISQKAYESGNFTSQPISTGPYKVSEYVVGSHVSLERNENYWQKPELTDMDHRANVETIEYDIIAETSQHVIALSTDTIQYSQYVPGENLGDFAENGQYADGHEVYVTQGSALEVLMANCTEGKITADPNFRLALWYALDNEAIATAVGTYLPAKAFGTPFFGDYVDAWESAEGNYQAVMDQEKAKEYLDKTDYNGETLVLYGTSDEACKTALTMIQALLLNVGINTEIKVDDGNMLEDNMLDPSTWDILYKDCGGGCQIGEFNRFMNRNEFGTGSNMAFINDDKLQELFETASILDTHDDEHMTALVDYVQENGYFYAVCSPQINAVYSDCFATLAFHEGEFLRPGACEYYLD